MQGQDAFLPLQGTAVFPRRKTCGFAGGSWFFPVDVALVSVFRPGLKGPEKDTAVEVASTSLHLAPKK